MKHSLSLSPKALTLSTGHTRILKAHAIYKVWDYQRGKAAGSLEDVVCVCVQYVCEKVVQMSVTQRFICLGSLWSSVMGGFGRFSG